MILFLFAVKVGFSTPVSLCDVISTLPPSLDTSGKRAVPSWNLPQVSPDSLLVSLRLDSNPSLRFLKILSSDSPGIVILRGG